jgi:hypothetical protein
MPSDRALRAAEKFNRFAEQIGSPGRCDPHLSFENPALMGAAAVWRDKAAGRGMPLRSDLNARTLKAFLPNVAIVDVVDGPQARRFRLRVMGTSVSRLLGDHTGKYLDEAVASPYRERWRAALEATLDAGGPVRMWGRLDYRRQDYRDMEMLVAPVGPRSVEAVLVVAYAQVHAGHAVEPPIKAG